MDDSDEDGMGRRLGRIAGLYVLVLVLARLTRLLQTAPELPRWDLILVAATVLGGVVWWLISQTSLKSIPSAYLFNLGGILVFLRVAVPGTLVYGVVPTADTLPVLQETMTIALRVIRSGVPPVYPEAGVIAVLALLLWLLGGLYAYGATTGHLTVMIVPAGVIYLQFAIFDRRQAGPMWMALAGLGLVLAIASVSLDRRHHVGRARDTKGQPKTHRSAPASLAMATMAAVLAVVTATSASGMVSEYGNVPWRSGFGGSGAGSGGVAVDRFADLRQRLQSRSNALLFQATLGRDSPHASQIYWRLEALDVFTGIGWRRGGSQIRNYEPGIALGDPDHAYQGTTVTVLQRVLVSRLAGELVPVAGIPTEIHEIDEDGFLSPRSFRMGRDATLYYPSGLLDDDQYQVAAEFPVYETDLGALATAANGELSPIFAAAAEAGEFIAEASPPADEITPPDDLEFFTRLPSDLPSQLLGIALRQTRGATTDFERAWMLQHWFRDSGDFDYSLNVSTGSGALDLAEWLDDPESENYRTGYCEQFAVSMAVLARQLGIPSRVIIGFTPGAATTVDGVEVIQVRDTNLHAWVEMWMDGFGWVRFDPTPRGDFQPESLTAGFDPAEFIPEAAPPAVGVPEVPPDVVGGPGFVEDPDFAPAGSGGPRWWILIFPVVALFFSVIPLIKRLRRRRRLARLRNGDITAAWDEIIDRLADMGEPIDDSLTPLELARTTDSAMLPLAHGYSAAVYGGKRSGATEKDLITMEWWLQTRFDASRRLFGALNPKSLMDRQG